MRDEFSFPDDDYKPDAPENIPEDFDDDFDKDFPDEEPGEYDDPSPYPFTEEGFTVPALHDPNLTPLGNEPTNPDETCISYGEPGLGKTPPTNPDYWAPHVPEVNAMAGFCWQCDHCGIQTTIFIPLEYMVGHIPLSAWDIDHRTKILIRTGCCEKCAPNIYMAHRVFDLAEYRMIPSVN